jgi:choline dehydrogenase-like flavoprotein
MTMEAFFYYGAAYPVQIDIFKKQGVDLTNEAAELKKDLPYVGPLRDNMTTPMARSIRESAQALGHNKWDKLDKFIIQDKGTSDYRFGYWGDPSGVKWSAIMRVRDALKEGATLFTQAKVKRVLIENKKAIGVEFRMKGSTAKVYAPKIVIAAGGIGTPVILRASGIEAVGYNFFFDPLITVCGENKHLVRRNEIPMQMGMNDHEEGLLYTDMDVGGWWVDNILAIEKLRLDQMFKGKHTQRIMIKMRDNLGGRLTDGGQVLKILSEQDRKRIKHGGQVARKILEHAGCKSIYQTYFTAAHPGGTVKLGEFVDTNLKTQYENLYVCDASVIPEPWGLPPVYTILALGKYLSKHLAGEPK